MTVADVDRLVLQDDAAAARLWPRLGPKVRAAYLEDRDAWVVLRRRSEAGRPPTPAALTAKHRAFSDWARAFHAAGRRRRPAPAAAAPAAGPPPPASAASTATAPLPAPTPSLGPPLATVHQASSGAGGAVAGGLVLAGLIALAARRTRA